MQLIAGGIYGVNVHIVAQDGKRVVQSIDPFERQADAHVAGLEHHSRGGRVAHCRLYAACGRELLAATGHLVYHGAVDRRRANQRRKNRDQDHRGAGSQERPICDPIENGSMPLLVE